MLPLSRESCSDDPSEHREDPLGADGHSAASRKQGDRTMMQSPTKPLATIHRIVVSGNSLDFVSGRTVSWREGFGGSSWINVERLHRLR